MDVQNVSRALMYLGLLALSLMFCWQNILDFMEGKTSYSIKQEYITVADLPTICFCLSSKYNLDEDFVAFIFVYSPNKYNVVDRPLQLMENYVFCTRTILCAIFVLRQFRLVKSKWLQYKYGA